MPRSRRAPKAPSSTRRFRYLGETPGVLADVRHVTGSTLLAHPNGIYMLHPDHDTDPDFEHPLLEATDAEAFDPTYVPDAPAPGEDPDPDSTDTGEPSEES